MKLKKQFINFSWVIAVNTNFDSFLCNNMERLIGSEYLGAGKDFMDHEIRPQFTDVETEVQGRYMTCSKSHSLKATRIDLNTRLLTLSPQLGYNGLIHSLIQETF